MADRLLGGRFPLLPVVAVGAPIGAAVALKPLLALAAVGAALIAVLVLLRAQALLFVLVAALPWEDALDWPTEQVTVVKLLGLALFAAWAVRATTVRGERLKLTPSMVPVVLFGVAIGVSLLASPEPEVGVTKFLRYALFLVFYFLVIQLVPDKRAVRRMLAVLALSATAAAVWALYRFLVLGDIGRAAGPIKDPNDFANLLVATLPLIGYLFASSRRGGRLLWAACFVFVGAALLATLSRGALVGLTAVAIWAVVTRRIPVGGVVVGAVLLVTVAAAAFAVWGPLIDNRLEQKGHIANQNVGARKAFWIAATRMWADRPLTGVGPARFGREAPEYVRNNPLILPDPVVHNSYLEILAESGIFALLAFLGYLWSTWRLLGRARRRALLEHDTDGTRMATAMQATWIVAIVSAIFLSAQLTTPFWLIGALATVVAQAGTAPAAVPARRLRPAAAPA
jgi:putative inorganic carbon (HCO3(-)) transporter